MNLDELKSMVRAGRMEILDTGCSFHDATDSWLDVIIVDNSSKVQIFSKSVPFIDFHDTLSLSY